MDEVRKIALLEKSGAHTGQHQEVSQIGLLAGSVIADVTGSFTLTDDYNGKIVRNTGASNITVTVPAGLRAGFACGLLQWGEGTVTVAADTGATVSEPDDQLELEKQYVLASLIAVAADTYLLAGRTTA